jgi:protein-L-isoaspartate O-methyltransferase
MADSGRAIFVGREGCCGVGLAEFAPYDVIRIHGAVKGRIPNAVVRQLAPSGRLVSSNVSFQDLLGPEEG